MRKGILFAVCGLFCLSAPIVVSAGQQAGGGSTNAEMPAGGFSGPGPSLTTAQDAAAMWDDSYVILRGNIVQHLGGDKYVFKDASGTICLEIDHDRWFGQRVTPNDTVELMGKVDRGRSGVEIEVKRLSVVK